MTYEIHSRAASSSAGMALGAATAANSAPTSDLPSGTAANSPGASSASGAFSRRRESLAESVEALKGKPGVTAMRYRLQEATHTLLAAELQGRE